MSSNRKAQINAATEAIKSLTETPYPTLGIDLDGCVDEAPVFFKLLTNCWPGQVVVITWRSERIKTEADLAKFGVRWDELILVTSLEAKAQVVAEKGILVYFDDQPEALKNIPLSVNVMLFRNGGNFDFDERLWLHSQTTGKLF